MKVKQLIAELKKLNPEADVFLSSDAEGNNFHGLAEVEETTNEKTILWSDDTYYDEIS